jgi:hypothetical protein
VPTSLRHALPSRPKAKQFLSSLFSEVNYDRFEFLQTASDENVRSISK